MRTRIFDTGMSEIEALRQRRAEVAARAEELRFDGVVSFASLKTPSSMLIGNIFPSKAKAGETNET